MRSIAAGSRTMVRTLRRPPQSHRKMSIKKTLWSKVGHRILSGRSRFGLARAFGGLPTLQGCGVRSESSGGAGTISLRRAAAATSTP